MGVTPTKFRKDFYKAALRAGVATLAIAFVVADTSSMIDAQTQDIQKLKTPATAATIVPIQSSSGPAGLIKNLAEIFAGARDERDRVNGIGEAIDIQRSNVSGGNKIAPAR